MIQVLHRALSILELLAVEPGKIHSLGEIAETFGLNRATCANILKTLAERNYVQRLSRRRGYRLGPMAEQLRGARSLDQAIVSAARPVLRQLTESLNETSLVGVLRGHTRVTLDSVQCDRDLQARSRQVRPAYETATGRLLVAFLPADRLEPFLQTAGLPAAEVWPGVDTRQRLDRALARIRKTELARTKSPEHIVGLAVPIRRSDEVVASVSVYLPEIRFRAPRRQQITTALRAAGHEITRRLTEGAT
jgi:DNA-binding IclR family transcriptional regulator